MATDGNFSSGGRGRKPCITSFVNHGTIESHRFYLARRTILEMLKDRGYGIPDSELSRSLDEFRSVFGNKPNLDHLRISASLLSNPSKKILVIFCGTDQIRKQVIVGIFSQIAKESLHRVILILQSKMNCHARKVVDDFPTKVEIFQITDLLANITKHVLVPKNEILTLEEKQKLLQKYHVEDKELPRMLEDDKIGRYYGLEKGQVVKVSYGGPLTDSFVTYRCVM